MRWWLLAVVAATDLAVLLTLKGVLFFRGSAAMAAWRSGCFRCVVGCEAHILSALRAATGELLAGLLSKEWVRSPCSFGGPMETRAMGAALLSFGVRAMSSLMDVAASRMCVVLRCDRGMFVVVALQSI